MTGVCSRLGQVKRLHSVVEAFLGVRRKQQYMPGITVGGVGTRHDIALLRPGRHAGRGTDALNVEQERREFQQSNRNRGIHSLVKCPDRWSV